MAEQAAHNRWVLGSNPSGATTRVFRIRERRFFDNRASGAVSPPTRTPTDIQRPRRSRGRRDDDEEKARMAGFIVAPLYGPSHQPYSASGIKERGRRAPPWISKRKRPIAYAMSYCRLRRDDTGADKKAAAGMTQEERLFLFAISAFWVRRNEKSEKNRFNGFGGTSLCYNYY